MASLWKHPQSKFWTACFTSPDGRQLKRSTKTTDKKLAMKLAEEFEQAARTQRTLRQARVVISDLHKELSGSNVESMSLMHYVENWLERRELEVSPATMKFYRSCTTKFTKWLGDTALKNISLIDADHIVGFRNSEATGHSVKTVNHHLKCLRMVFKAAKRDGYISQDPSEFVDTIKKTAIQPSASIAKRRPFSTQEIQRVLDHCDDEWRSIVLFGFYTGQRLGDIANLTWLNVNIEKEAIQLVTAKTKKLLNLPIAPPLLAQLKHQRSRGQFKVADPLHPKAFEIASKNGTGHLSGIFSRVLVAAGLREKAKHVKKEGPRSTSELSFHSLRYSATTQLQAAGIAPGITQEFIGHESEEIHQHYARFGMDNLRKAADALPDVTNRL